MVTLTKVSKSYGSTVAVRDMSLELGPGEIVGLLGANGAGKTTTLKMIMGILRPDSGQIRFQFGSNHRKVDVRTRMGYLPEDAFVYDKLTGREFLRFVGTMQDVPEDRIEGRIEDLLCQFEMEDHGDELVDTYSKGMKRKTSLCAALIHQPDLLILDEPTDSLDVMAIKSLKDTMAVMREDGHSVLLSTHVLAVAEEVCDRFVMLHRGLTVCQGTTLEIKKATGKPEASLEVMFLEMTRRSKECSRS